MDSEGCSNIALQIKSSDKIRFLSVITCFVGRKKKIACELVLSIICEIYYLFINYYVIYLAKY